MDDNGHLARPGNDSQGFSSLRSSVLSIADPVLVGSKTQRDTHHADNSLGGAAERARAASCEALDVLVKTRIKDDRTELAASAQHIVAFARQVSVLLSRLLPSLRLSLLHSRHAMIDIHVHMRMHMHMHMNNTCTHTSVHLNKHTRASTCTHTHTQSLTHTQLERVVERNGFSLPRSLMQVLKET